VNASAHARSPSKRFVQTVRWLQAPVQRLDTNTRTHAHTHARTHAQMLPQEHTWKRQEPLCENRFRIGATLRSFGPTCALLREIGVQTPFRSEQQQALLLNRCSRRDRSTIRRSIDQSQRSQAAATAAVRLAARCACRIASCTNTHDTAAGARHGYGGALAGLSKRVRDGSRTPVESVW
jgi:hypothetical protein